MYDGGGDAVLVPVVAVVVDATAGPTPLPVIRGRHRVNPRSVTVARTCRRAGPAPTSILVMRMLPGVTSSISSSMPLASRTNTAVPEPMLLISLSVRYRYKICTTTPRYAALRTRPFRATRRYARGLFALRGATLVAFSRYAALRSAPPSVVEEPPTVWVNARSGDHRLRPPETMTDSPGWVFPPRGWQQRRTEPTHTRRGRSVVEATGEASDVGYASAQPAATSLAVATTAAATARRRGTTTTGGRRATTTAGPTHVVGDVLDADFCDVQRHGGPSRHPPRYAALRSRRPPRCVPR